MCTLTQKQLQVSVRSTTSDMVSVPGMVPRKWNSHTSLKEGASAAILAWSRATAVVSVVDSVDSGTAFTFSRKKTQLFLFSPNFSNFSAGFISCSLMVRVFQDFAVLETHFRRPLHENSWQGVWPEHQNIVIKFIFYCSYSCNRKHPEAYPVSCQVENVWRLFSRIMLASFNFNDILKISVGFCIRFPWPYFCPPRIH